MERTGSIDKALQLFIHEEMFMESRDRTPASKNLRSTRKTLSVLTREVGTRGDLGEVLALENAFLQNDLDRHANSTGMKSSLEAALTELQAAEAVLPLVKDPVVYDAVDKGHGHPKSRVGALPNDAARRFFKSNAARLLNMDKSRLDPEEKQLIDQRKVNMRTAEKIYIALQRQALGLPPQQRGKGMGDGPGL